MGEREVLLHTMGLNLRHIRKSMNMSQRKFCEVLEIPKWSTYHRYEAGERFLPQPVLLKLITLGWNANWLLTGVGESKLDR